MKKTGWTFVNQGELKAGQYGSLEILDLSLENRNSCKDCKCVGECARRREMGWGENAEKC